MRWIILVGCISIVLACIFPPWEIHFDGNGLSKRYSFFLTPPKVTYYSLDLKTLITEIVVIVVLTGIIAVLLRKLK